MTILYSQISRGSRSKTVIWFLIAQGQLEKHGACTFYVNNCVKQPTKEKHNDALLQWFKFYWSRLQNAAKLYLAVMKYSEEPAYYGWSVSWQFQRHLVSLLSIGLCLHSCHQEMTWSASATMFVNISIHRQGHFSPPFLLQFYQKLSTTSLISSGLNMKTPVKLMSDDRKKSADNRQIFVR